LDQSNQEFKDRPVEIGPGEIEIHDRIRAVLANLPWGDSLAQAAFPAYRNPVFFEEIVHFSTP
jgi:hypothetical protein